MSKYICEMDVSAGDGESTTVDLWDTLMSEMDLQEPTEMNKTENQHNNTHKKTGELIRNQQSQIHESVAFRTDKDGVHTFFVHS